MKKSTLLTPFLALVTALTAIGADEATLLIQAESTADDIGATVMADGDALEGSYAMNDRDYNPVFKMDTPTGAESYTIWIRARGTGLQLKAAPEAGQSQKELKWIWKPGKTWTWKSYGTFPAADLGAQIVIIRGKEPADDAGLDAVIITSDPGFDPTVDGAVEGLSDQ
jgi:hypothetical protein